MIISETNKLGFLKTIGKNFEIAVNFLMSADLDKFDEGRHEIAGRDVYMVVSSYKTRNHDVSKYETHDRYADIQCLAGGEEIIFWNARSAMKISGNYDSDKDKTNYLDASGAVSILLKSGMAAVFFPEDAHKACCKVGNEPIQVRKILLKVRLA